MRHGRRIDAVPVFRDFLLRLFERQAAGAHFRVEIVLHLILGVRAAIGDGGLKRLGPEIFRVGGIPPSSSGIKWSSS